MTKGQKPGKEPRKRPGSAKTRLSVARAARDARNRFKYLHGGWSRREWNYQVRIFIAHHLKGA